MKIFYWVDSLNHQQLGTWDSVEELSGEPVTYIITEVENQTRKLQGWPKKDISNKNVVLLDKKKWFADSRRLINSNKEAVHVFYGFWSERKWFPIILYSLKQGVKIAILQEPYNESSVGYNQEEFLVVSKLKIFLRPFLYKISAALINKNSADKKRPCIFPISLIAYQQFIKAGFDKDSLFPYGYFVHQLKTNHRIEVEDFSIRLVFVGSLLRRKGLDVAIDAITMLTGNGRKVTLDVYGPGDPKLFIPNNSKQIIYKGVIPTEQTQTVIANYDALLLPSRHDGWGLVVNEALLQGVPAIVSNKVGAKCLLERSGAGIVFRSEDAYELSRIFAELSSEPARLKEMRHNAELVGHQILPKQGAQYLLNVLSFYFFGSGVKPNAIWTE